MNIEAAKINFILTWTNGSRSCCENSRSDDPKFKGIAAKTGPATSYQDGFVGFPARGNQKIASFSAVL
jgi:hypothetical protein